MSIRTAMCGFSLLLLSLATVVVSGQKCRSSDVSMALASKYNATGHWETTVRVLRSSSAPGRGLRDVQIEVQPSTSICDVRYDAVVVTLRGPPLPPSPSYVEVPGVGYYRIHLEHVTWAEAKVICESEGAHLLIINSAEEDRAIVDLLKRTPNLPTWLFVGFHDRDKEGKYVTIFGDLVSSLPYQRWEPGQPDDHNHSEDCGTVWSKPPTGGLNDYPCGVKIGFICEQRLA